MKRSEKQAATIRLIINLAAIFMLAGVFYFTQNAFAQLPPPPPPPPPISPTPTPLAGGSPTSAYICSNTAISPAICCNITASRTDAQALAACSAVCTGGFSCIGIMSGGCGSGGENCPSQPACQTSPACSTDQDCASVGQGYICGASKCCVLGTTGTFGAVQCQIPSGTATVFQCFPAQSGETSLASATSRCQASCLLSAGGQCVPCPQGSACTNSADCRGGGSTGTKPGYQFPNTPGARYGSSDCPPSQCPPAPGPGQGSIDLTSLKPGNFSDFLSLLSCVFSFLLYFAIPIAVLVFVLAGVMFLTSRGEPDKITTAKKIVLWGAVGFSVVLLAKGILSTILLFFGSSALQISCKFFS